MRKLHYEISIVSLSYASSNHAAMMIEDLYTVAAAGAMARLFWPNHETGLTKSCCLVVGL